MFSGNSSSFLICAVKPNSAKIKLKDSNASLGVFLAYKLIPLGKEGETNGVSFSGKTQPANFSPLFTCLAKVLASGSNAMYSSRARIFLYLLICSANLRSCSCDSNRGANCNSSFLIFWSFSNEPKEIMATAVRLMIQKRSQACLRRPERGMKRTPIRLTKAMRRSTAIIMSIMSP